MKRILSVILIFALMVNFTVTAIPENSANYEQARNFSSKYDGYRFDIFDALEILSDVVKIKPLTAARREFFDFKGDGVVDIFNALQVLSWIVGLPSEYGRNPDRPPTSSEMEAEAIRIVNAERAKFKLPPFSGDNAALNAAARKRAEEIIVWFKHERPDGRDWATIFPEYNIKWAAIGENIAAGCNTAQEMVDMLMDSPPHRSSILSSGFTHIGIGAVWNPSNKTWYWVQLFLKTF